MHFLQKISNMSLETITKVVDDFEERIFLKNEFFLREGKICDHLYLIEGVMRAYTTDFDGNEVTTNIFLPGRAAYDPASFFLQTRSMENIQAITDCLAYSISFEKVNKLFHALPEFRDYGRLTLVKELVSYKQRTLTMVIRSAEERYEDLIKNNEDIFQFVQLKHIASYLGVTNSSLSRIRREYSRH